MRTFINYLKIMNIKDSKLDKSMKLDLLRTLQLNNTELIVGGSIALYLQGVRLKRFEIGNCDFDFCLPFYKDISLEGESSDSYDKPSGSDYDYVLNIKGVKTDVRIDNKQKFKVVEYNGFKYKVVPLETIILAKAKYAHTKWGGKHLNDLKEMICK